MQPVVVVSPPKWHLAHATWFFETFILLNTKGYRPFHKDYNFFFNSYYNTVGDRVVRADRGNMSRPTVDEIFAYRQYVDEHIVGYIGSMDRISDELAYVLEIGINHEQQHQELLVTDIKYILGHNPMFPAYVKKGLPGISDKPGGLDFLKIEGGLVEIGHNGEGFCYDNEMRRHKYHLESFSIANRVISNGEYLEFIEDGGYSEFSYWLSDGWEWVKTNGVRAPLYWHFYKGEWYEYTLFGFEKLDLSAPLTHTSFFEADAFANWKGMRLLTEFEWEYASSVLRDSVNPVLFDGSRFHPSYQKNSFQFIGNVWEWTSSAYLPYPGFKKAEGALGEYNGKFMANQKVLRGGSVATPVGHIRNTYRNFFHPHLRWQFTGIRLAK